VQHTRRHVRTVNKQRGISARRW